MAHLLSRRAAWHVQEVPGTSGQSSSTRPSSALLSDQSLRQRTRSRSASNLGQPKELLAKIGDARLMRMQYDKEEWDKYMAKQQEVANTYRGPDAKSLALSATVAATLRMWSARHLGQGFDAWLVFAEGCRRSKLEFAAVAQVRRCRLAAALASWLRTCAEVVRRQQSLIHMFNCELGRGLRSWRASVAKRHRALDWIRKSVVFLRNRQLALGWRRWVVVYALLLRSLEVIDLALRRFVNNFLARGFRSWEVLWREFVRARDAMVRSLSHMRSHELSHAWRAWQVAVLRDTAARGRLSVSGAASRRGSLSAALRVWLRVNRQSLIEHDNRMITRLQRLESGWSALVRAWQEFALIGGRKRRDLQRDLARAYRASPFPPGSEFFAKDAQEAKRIRVLRDIQEHRRMRALLHLGLPLKVANAKPSPWSGYPVVPERTPSAGDLEVLVGIPPGSAGLASSLPVGGSAKSLLRTPLRSASASTLRTTTEARERGWRSTRSAWPGEPERILSAAASITRAREYGLEGPAASSHNPLSRTS